MVDDFYEWYSEVTKALEDFFELTDALYESDYEKYIEDYAGNNE